MQAAQDEINPFALMVHPETVFQALERCESLGRLKRRICRPLDIGESEESALEQAAFDLSPRANSDSQA